MTPLEGRLGPDVPGPPRPPSQKIRKVVVRKAPSGTMRAAPPLPLAARKKLQDARDPVTIPAPPPEAPTPEPGPEAVVASPIVMVNAAPSLATPIPSTAPPAPLPPAVRQRRWLPRIALLGLVVGAELVYAQRTGALALEMPHDAGRARAMVAALLGGTSAGGEAVIPPDMGLLDTSASKPGHRIFIDERTVGETPSTVLVKCGAATVRIGSAGRSHALTIPCGEGIALDDR
jgi:hypothetical protein